MHEARKSLTTKQKAIYAEELVKLLYNGEVCVPCFEDNWYMLFLVIDATSQQRALAFIKTIQGKEK